MPRQNQQLAGFQGYQKDPDPLGTENFGQYYLQPIDPNQAGAIRQAQTGGSGWNILRGILGGAGALASGGGNGIAQIPLALLGGIVGGVGQGAQNRMNQQAFDAQLSGVTGSINQNNTQFQRDRDSLIDDVRKQALLRGFGNTPMVRNNLPDVGGVSSLEEARKRLENLSDDYLQPASDRLGVASALQGIQEFAPQAGRVAGVSDPRAGQSTAGPVQANSVPKGMARLGVTDPTTGAQLRGEVTAEAPMRGPSNLDYLWEGDNVIRYGGTAADKINAVKAAIDLGRAPNQNAKDQASAMKDMANVDTTPSQIERNKADAEQSRTQARVGIPAQATAATAQAGQSRANAERMGLENARLKQWESLYKSGRITEEDFTAVRNASQLSQPKDVWVLNKGQKADDISPLIRNGKQVLDPKLNRPVYYNRKTGKVLRPDAWSKYTIGGSKAKEGGGSALDALLNAVPAKGAR